MTKFKKLVLISTSILLLTVSNNEAKAENKSSKINYYNQTVAKQVLKGSLSVDGFKLGKSFDDYLNRPNYNELFFKGSMNYEANDYNLAIADNYKQQNNSNEVITRIIDVQEEDIFVDKKPKFEMKKMLKIYGKPLYSFKKGTTYGYGYKNAFLTFYQKPGSKNAYLYTMTMHKFNSNDAKLFKKYAKDNFFSYTFFAPMK